MMWLPRASTSPSGEMRISTPIAGAPARLSFAARSAGESAVELGALAVHRQQRGGLGEAVDLDELPAELGLDALDRLRRRRCAGDARCAPGRAPGIGPSHVGRGVEDHVGHRRRAAHHGDAVLLDAAQDLGAVDLADDDVLGAHAGDGVEHAPAVAVELRQRVQVHVAVVDAELPAERGGVEPDVAVGELHALRAGPWCRWCS